jgi:hypothetical protein
VDEDPLGALDALVCVWTAVLLAAAAVLLRRRDA